MKTGFRTCGDHFVSACLVFASLFCFWNEASAAYNYSVPLTLEDRVHFERAIEQVYWNHRIWPKENSAPKPPLDTVLPEASVRAKVDDDLRKSNALAEDWRQQITAAQLQAEMDRMVRNSQSPVVLRELFLALKNDPYVIAECLARPILADRLIHNWYAYDSRFHGALKEQAQSELRQFPSARLMRNLSGEYTETEWVRSQGNDAAPDHPNARVITLNPEEWEQWTAGLRARFGAAEIPIGILSPLKEEETAFLITTVLEKHPGRLRVAAVRWQKQPFDAWWAGHKASMPADINADLAAYTLPAITGSSSADDTWAAPSAAAPSPRYSHTAVWTGSEMIVWGGWDGVSLFNTGGSYHPSTDNWTATSTAGAPAARVSHAAVWTGSQMIVWGGSNNSAVLNTGGRYDPSTDSWSATSTTAAPEARYPQTSVWTGSQMIVWGGDNGNIFLNTGGRYDPSNDSWGTMSTTGAPDARDSQTEVWTGSLMIVWGGVGSAGAFNTGGRYDPSNDTWTATSTSNAPSARNQQSGVWTGSLMIVWGGIDGSPFSSGGRYDPSSDSWTATSSAGAPAARFNQTAVWTGSQMIVWGGNDGGGTTNTGGRYDLSSDSWTTTSTVAVPTGRQSHTAVWSGTEMIVWGGIDASPSPLNTGGRYDPSTDTWSDIGACLFCDDFEDGVLASDWTYVKPDWSETGGDLIGTPAGKKAVTVATPAFAGCQVCSVEATISTAGGTGNRVWLMGWYLDKKNTVELMMKQESGRWILKELAGGRTVAKGKGLGTILPNVSYDAVVQFDGTQFIVTVDGTEVLRMTPAAGVPTGTVGFQVKSTTAHFGEINVN